MRRLCWSDLKGRQTLSPPRDRSLGWSSAWCSAVPLRGPGTLSDEHAKRPPPLHCNLPVLWSFQFGSIWDGQDDLWECGTCALNIIFPVWVKIIHTKLNKMVFSLKPIWNCFHHSALTRLGEDVDSAAPWRTLRLTNTLFCVSLLN